MVRRNMTSKDREDITNIIMTGQDRGCFVEHSKVIIEYNDIAVDCIIKAITSYSLSYTNPLRRLAKRYLKCDSELGLSILIYITFKKEGLLDGILC